jgi:hypothetical protein
MWEPRCLKPYGPSRPVYRDNFTFHRFYLAYVQENWDTGIRFTAEARRFSGLHNLQTRSGAHTNSKTMSVGGFPPVWSGPEIVVHNPTHVYDVMLSKVVE